MVIISSFQFLPMIVSIFQSPIRFFLFDDCVVDGSTGLLMFKVVLDDDATHVVKTMRGTTGGVVKYDLYKKTSDNADSYTGTVVAKE